MPALKKKKKKKSKRTTKSTNSSKQQSKPRTPETKETEPMAKTDAQTDTATIQNKIAEPLKKAIAPLLEQPATVFDEQIKSLEKLLNKADELPRGTVQSTRDSLRAMEEARDRTNEDYLASVRGNIATAVIAAVRDIDSKIPLGVKQSTTPATAAATPRAASTGSRGGRGQNQEFILEQLKANGKMKAADIKAAAEAAGLKAGSVYQALKPLAETGKIKAVEGERGTYAPA